MFRVSEHTAPGNGVNICDGAAIVAKVLGTSYPLGTACERDIELARIMAAAPALLAAAQAILDEGSWHDDGSFVYYPPSADDGGAIDKAFAAVTAATGAA